MTIPAQARLTVAQLNDDLRANLYKPGKHQIELTAALITAIGDKSIFKNFSLEKRIKRAVYQFEFAPDDQGDHDLGYFEVSELKCFFRIAAFDNSLTKRSPDPHNEKITTRVLTIMLHHEY